MSQSQNLLNIESTASKTDDLNPHIQQSSSDDFSVDINFVGTSFLNNSKIEPNSFGVYQVNSDFSTTGIVLKFDFSGTTSWNLGEQGHRYTNQTIDYGSTSTTLGQFYISYNGILERLQGPEVTSSGVTANLPHGIHTISILYLNYQQDGNLEYATDSVVVSIQNIDDETQAQLNLLEREVSLNLIDLEPNDEEPVNASVWRWSSLKYVRWLHYIPETNTSITIDGISLNPGIEVVELENETLSVSIDALSNSSYGFPGMQVQSQDRNVPGYHFIFDATGFQLLSDQDLTQISLRYGSNYVGIATFSPYGIWHVSTTIPDGIPCSDCSSRNIDWDTRLRTIPDPTNSSNELQLDSSFDFVSDMDGEYFFFVKQDIVTSETSESLPLFSLHFLSITSFMILMSVLRRERE